STPTGSTSPSPCRSSTTPWSSTSSASTHGPSPQPPPPPWWSVSKRTSVTKRTSVSKRTRKGSMAHTAQPQGGGRLGRTVSGLAAGLVLLLLVIGLPFVLVQVAGNPLSGLPIAGDLWTVLTSRDNGQLFLRALAIVGC